MSELEELRQWIIQSQHLWSGLAPTTCESILYKIAEIERNPGSQENRKYIFCASADLLPGDRLYRYIAGTLTFIGTASTMHQMDGGSWYVNVAMPDGHMRDYTTPDRMLAWFVEK